MASISDLLFEMTEWLRTTPVLDLSLWIDSTSLRNWLQEHFFAIPIMQTLHILTIALTFFSVVLVYMRVLGVGGMSRTMPETMKRYSAAIWWGLAVLIITGIGMIIGEPVRELVNPIFWIKMGMVVALILLSALYYGTIRRQMTDWDRAGSHLAIRISGFGLVLLWCFIMAGGRWIAYAPV